MKIKVRYLMVLFTVVLIGLSAGCSVPQKDGQKKGEAKKVVINLIELGEKMNIPVEEVVIPNGNKVKVQEWNKEHIKRAITELNYCFNEPQNTYLLTESPDPWVTLALIEALQPLKVLYLYPRADGVELDMCELKKGQQTPNYDVVFEIVQEGDNVFINLNSDRPEATTIGHHTFETGNLCKVVIPEIPAGKHVFVHGKGMYCVMVCVARNYVKNSKSVSLASHDTDYTCAVSYTDEREIGDVTPRTLKNNL